MRMVYGFSSGNRISTAIKAAEAWRKAGFILACTTWDIHTAHILQPHVDYMSCQERKSWGDWHNLRMDEVPDWDVYVCGNDDILPKTNVGMIEEFAKTYPGMLLGVGTDIQASSMPIITRGWYETHRPVFDSQFTHYFTDYDAVWRALVEEKFRICREIDYDHIHETQEKSATEVISHEFWDIHESHIHQHDADRLRLLEKWANNPDIWKYTKISIPWPLKEA